MADRPSFQFYPADWKANSNLRRCSWAARGVWIEVLGLMHDGEVYGTLRWSLKEIATALGCPISLLKELVAKGVLKGADKGKIEPYIYRPKTGRKMGEPVTLVCEDIGPFWYSSRMVRDEHIRLMRGQTTRFGEAPNPSPKPSPKGGFGEAPKAAPKPVKSDGSSSSSSSSYKSPTVSVGVSNPRGPHPDPAIALADELFEITGLDPIKVFNPGWHTDQTNLCKAWLETKSTSEITEAIRAVTVRNRNKDPAWKPESLRYFQNAIHEYQPPEDVSAMLRQSLANEAR